MFIVGIMGMRFHSLISQDPSISLLNSSSPTSSVCMGQGLFILILWIFSLLFFFLDPISDMMTPLQAISISPITMPPTKLRDILVAESRFVIMGAVRLISKVIRPPKAVTTSRIMGIINTSILW